MQYPPRIQTVAAQQPATLLVCFDNGIKKTYDCHRILALPQFQLMRDPAFFRAVRVDSGGYGVSWNDDIDLSEYELWTHGQLVLP